MRFLIGKLYMETCPHCVTLAPIWKEMRENIDRKNKENNMGLDIEYIEEEADGIDHKLENYNRKYYNGESKIQVQQGYPTLFFGVPEKKVDYYDGERTTDALENWYMDKMGIQKTEPIEQRVVVPESQIQPVPNGMGMGIIKISSLPVSDYSSVKKKKRKTKKNRKSKKKSRKNRQNKSQKAK
jgi:hypothetical protein